VVYILTFFNFLYGFSSFYFSLGYSATKALGLKAGFYLISQRRRGAKFLFGAGFSSGTVHSSLFFLLETGALAPIEVEILLCRGSAQKIGADSGIKLLIVYCIKGFDFARPDNLNFLLIYMYKNKPDRF